MDRFVKLRSWHILRDDRNATLCGRPVTDPDTSADMPLDEKSCETCLRIDKAK